jgi:predicted RNase H-like nuclease
MPGSGRITNIGSLPKRSASPSELHLDHPVSQIFSTLLVGFDSAWTVTNRGAIAGAVRSQNGSLVALGDPAPASFPEAQAQIERWQGEHKPNVTVIMLDQPTIVPNQAGKRPVEDLVSSIVGARYGGMQPANTSRSEMFGPNAPVWPFLAHFGGPADPFKGARAGVFETYPVLAIIALGWTMPDARSCGRLPKYNPGRRTTFAIGDWQFICTNAANAFRAAGLPELSLWLERSALNPAPKKVDQDCVDALLCLLVAVHFAGGGSMLAVGSMETGYVFAPHCEALVGELERRCEVVSRRPSDWVHTV